MKYSKPQHLILVAIFSAYISSWFLPIIASNDSVLDNTAIGYDGAKYAFELLEDGITNFFNLDTDHVARNAADAINKIILGLPNILFISSFLLLLLKPQWGYSLSPFTLASMLIWFTPDNGIGYYVWLLSGFMLVIFSVILTKNQLNIAYTNFFTKKWSIPIYCPVIIILGLLLTAYATKIA